MNKTIKLSPGQVLEDIYGHERQIQEITDGEVVFLCRDPKSEMNWSNARCPVGVFRYMIRDRELERKRMELQGQIDDLQNQLEELG